MHASSPALTMPMVGYKLGTENSTGEEPSREGSTLHLAEEMVGITAAKAELPRRVKQLMRGDLEKVVIIRQNSPVAVIVAVDEYDRMQRLEDMNEELEELVAVLEAQRADNGVRVSLDDLKKKYGFE